MNAKQIFTFAIIAMFLIVPFASAAEGTADTVKQDKAIDKTAEPAKEIVQKDKSITGKITVTDSNTSAYTVTKEGDVAINIKKDGEHTKTKVTIPKEELQKIDEDGDRLYGVLHIADDGTTTHDIVTESELITGTEMTFSENIVNGYTGYYEKTQTGVTSGTTIDTPDVSGNYYVTYSVNGSIPAYSTISETNASTYPDSPVHVFAMDGNTNDATGRNNGVGTGISYTTDMFGRANSAVAFSPSTVSRIVCAKPFVANTTYTSSYWIKWTNITPINYATIWSAGSVGNGIHTWIYSNKYAFRINTTEGGFSEYSNPSYTPSTSWTHYALRYDGTNEYLYKNGKLVQTITAPGGAIRGLSTAALSMGYSKYNGNVRIDATLANMVLYNTSTTSNTISALYSGINGISVRPSNSYNFTGYNVTSGTEKIIDTDATCTGLEYIDTTSGTHTVTVRIYFTEDISKTTETKGAVYQNVSIIHTKQNATASVGTIPYELEPLYSGTPALTSNNTNATVTRNDTHAIISTGLVKQGQSFSYAVSVPDSHDHGFHLGNLMKWVGTGWDFVSTAPEDWTNYIGDEIEVIVS